MKKTLYSCVMLCVLSAFSSEDCGLSYFQTLLPELKIEIITHSGNVRNTVRCMSKMRIVCKSFASNSFQDAFLTAASNQFPGQEIRLARMLYTTHAASWLGKRRPDLKSYKPVSHCIESNMAIIKALQENDMDLLASCLDAGVNPTNYLFFLHAIKHDGNLPALKLLASYGADLLFRMQGCKKVEFCNGDIQPAPLVECVALLVKNRKSVRDPKALAYDSIYSYLKAEVSSD